MTIADIRSRVAAAWAAFRAGASAPLMLVNEGITYHVVLNHWLPVLLGHEACTLTTTIRAAGNTLAAQTHCHEFQHVKQILSLGQLKYWLVYTLDECEHGYPTAASNYLAGNPLEVAAYAVELQFAAHPTAEFIDVVNPGRASA